MLVCNSMLENRDQNAEEFSRTLEAYLAGTLHQKVRLSTWPDTNELPLFLGLKYTFYRTKIAHQPCLFMVAMDEQGGTPAETSKHIKQVQRVFGGIVAFASPRMSSHQRARLITHGVAFAVPGNQLYIPQLGTDLREHFRARPSSHEERLSPVAQVVLFHHILGKNPILTTPSTLSDSLTYSPMSIGRAFDELSSLKLARITKKGREKHLGFDRGPQELIEAARPLLRSPVRKTNYVRGNLTTTVLKLAGETALAELSTLAPPAIQIFAKGGDKFEMVLVSQNLQQVKHEDEADAAIEIWRYEPAILSDSPVVDVLSLYAQFWNNTNERIAAAAANLLERLVW